MCNPKKCYGKNWSARHLMNCETCLYYEYDDEYEDYYCSVDMDEDDYARMLQHRECPYWRDGDEYRVVRKQL